MHKIRLKHTSIAVFLGTSLFLTACGNEDTATTSPKETTQTEQHDHASHSHDSASTTTTTQTTPTPTPNLDETTIELPDGQRQLKYKMVDGVKEFEITAQVVQWETKKGQTFEAYTYNGIVPGPQIRVTEGDKVRIKFTNKLPENTTIHWHGLHVPNSMDGVPGVTQESVKPNETFTYEFTAKNTGTHMFHSHDNPTMQVDKGMFANIIVDPKNKEQIYNFKKEFTMMLSDGSMGYLINGKSYPDTKTFELTAGEKVRIRLSNVGNQVHPFHLHGHTLTVVAKDGNELSKTAQYQADTIDLMPGDRYDVEFTPTEKGTWLYHCHVLHHVHGANGENTGMIQIYTVK